MQPLISVLIPTYNYGRYVTAAIDSVLAQTYPNVEVVVTDNASTDDTAAIVAARYGGDARVRYVRNERNLGLVPNFNYALTLARGEFVLWLSADDWILPRHLARLHDVFVRAPQVDVVYTTVYFADAKGRVFGVRSNEGLLPFDYIDLRDELPEMLTGVSQLTLPATLFRRALFDELGPMDEAIPVAADWELAVRLALAGKRFAFLAWPSACVRWHDANNSGVGYNQSGQIVVETVGIVAKFLDHPGMARVRGREAAIARYLDWLRKAKIEELGRNPFDADAERRFAEVQAALLARYATYEPARVRESLVSVVIPVLGPPGPALRALDSAAAQTFPNVQIVVADQSQIPLDELLRGHPARDRITYARLNAPHRPGAARNFGLRLTRGEYVAFLDEDNVFAPDHLAELVATIERLGSQVAASHALLVVERFDEWFIESTILATAGGIFRGAADPLEIGAVANALPLNAILLHRRFHEDAGPFSDDAWILEDFDYLSRLLTVAQLGFAPRATLEVRMRVEMRGQALRNSVAHYLPTLDALYDARAVSPELSGLRALHRAAVEQALGHFAALGRTPEGVIELVGALSGRSVFPARG